MGRRAWWATIHGVKSVGHELKLNLPTYNYILICMLLLLSLFSRIRLCATPWTAAYQASPSRGFSRKEHWSGLPFPSPMHESGKWKVKVKLLSRVWLLATPRTAAHQSPPSMGFSRQQYWSGVPLPSPWYVYIHSINPLVYGTNTHNVNLKIFSNLYYISNLPIKYIHNQPAAAMLLQSCPTLCDPIDGSPPGSPVPGILQARTLEWVAISFSNAWKWKWKWSFSVVSNS